MTTPTRPPPVHRKHPKDNVRLKAGREGNAILLSPFAYNSNSSEFRTWSGFTSRIWFCCNNNTQTKTRRPEIGQFSLTVLEFCPTVAPKVVALLYPPAPFPAPARSRLVATEKRHMGVPSTTSSTVVPGRRISRSPRRLCCTMRGQGRATSSDGSSSNSTSVANTVKPRPPESPPLLLGRPRWVQPPRAPLETL